MGNDDMTATLLVEVRELRKEVGQLKTDIAEATGFIKGIKWFGTAALGLFGLVPVLKGLGWWPWP